LSKIKKVVFDIEGTLFMQLEPLHFRCYIQAAFNLTRQTISFEEIVAHEPQVIGGGELIVSRAVAEICHFATSPEALFAEKERLFAIESASAHIWFRPGVEQFLADIRELGIPMATASVTPRAKGLRYLEMLSINEYIHPKNWVFLEDVQTPQLVHPTKRHVHAHLMRMRVIAGNEMLVIGDSVSDVVEARAAGCHVAVFPVFRESFVLQKLVAAGATRIFGGFEEVRAGGLIHAIESGVT
jgi:beta-phosphoglucomutase-like phosphatase (HAD superfamily)